MAQFMPKRQSEHFCHSIETDIEDFTNVTPVISYDDMGNHRDYINSILPKIKQNNLINIF